MPEAYPLASLLAVRQFREENAQRALAHANEVQEAAKVTAQTRRKELEECIVFNREETDRRYEKLIGSATNLEGLNRFHYGLAQLAQNERIRREAVADADNAVAKAEQEVQKAATAAKNAHKNTMKIEEHRKIWRTEQKKEAEHREDLELEEFRPTGRLGASADEAGF